MRRRGQIDLAASPFIKPDIRTLYITFILRFIQPTSTLHFLKSTFLDSHREIFLAIFKRLHEDPYPLVRTVLEASWEGIWQDNRLKKTLKISLFGEKTLALVRNCPLICTFLTFLPRLQLIKLYARTTAETSDPESIPADLVHHFLLALCTHPGTGLCFKDSGWYPRQEEDEHLGADGEIDDPESYRTSGDGRRQDKTGKTYNRIIGHLLKNLRPTEDARHQELATNIFQACPELVHG
jgi:nucleolar pre-ribosomal-associated protein 1